MISGSRIAGRFAFCTGRARRIPPARVWRFCTAPPLPRFAFRTGSASFHAAVRDPNRFSSPIQVRAGPQDPSAARPRVRLPAPAASFAQRARFCAEPVRVPGPGPSGTQTGFLLAQVRAGRAGPFRARPESGCPRRPRLRNGRAFAPNRRGPRARDHPNPNRFPSPAQVCAGPQDPSAPPPPEAAAGAGASFAQRARLAPNRRGVPGPGPSGTQIGFFLPHRSARRSAGPFRHPAPEAAARADRILCATGAPLRRTGAGPRGPDRPNPNRFFPPHRSAPVRRTFRSSRPRGCCPRGARPLRNGRLCAESARIPGPDRPGPKQVSSPAQVRAGPQDLPRPPRVRLPAPDNRLRNGAPLRRIGAGPRARTVRDPNRFFLPHRSAPAAQDPSAPRPRVRLPAPARPLRNGRAFAPNRYGSQAPDRLDPVPPFSLCAAPFCHCIFSRCGLIFLRA